MTNGDEDLRRLAERRLEIPKSLHSYQWEGVSFLYRSTGALLADEMGLGKTVQTAVAIALLLETTSSIQRVLIITPSSLTLNWINEISIWTPNVVARLVAGNSDDRAAFYALPIPVLVASYDQIRRDGFDRVPQNTFDLVVIDEAQRIKNRKSATSLACRLLQRKRSWALSATPLENQLDDIATILGFIVPPLELVNTRTSIDNKLRASMLRRRKIDVRGELPPVILQDIHLNLENEQRACYEDLWAQRSKYLSNSKREDIAELLGLITKLKVICNFDEDSGTSVKLDALTTFLDSVGKTGRTIVFSQFVRTLQWISQRLSTNHELLTGSMDLYERQTVMENFQSEEAPRVLLISLRAGGVGLNLEAASHVVMFDRWWNPSVENQAIYRAHRFSRSVPLHVVRFTIRHSIEERIAAILDEKAELFKEIVEDAPVSSHRFSRAELQHILKISH